MATARPREEHRPASPHNPHTTTIITLAGAVGLYNGVAYAWQMLS